MSMMKLKDAVLDVAQTTQAPQIKAYSRPRNLA
jgi:hypothetical protein